MRMAGKNNLNNSNKQIYNLKRSTNEIDKENEIHERYLALDYENTKISPQPKPIIPVEIVQREQNVPNSQKSPEPRKLFLVHLTPLKQNRHSGTFTSFQSEGTLPIIDTLKSLKKKKIRTSKQANTQSSFTSVENLIPNASNKVGEDIFNHPTFCQSDRMDSEFTSHCQIMKSKLSEIHLSRHKDNGQYYIIKSGHKANSGRGLSETSREIINEMKILALIGKHSHIVEYFHSWIEDSRFHIQTEFINGGSLRDFLIGNVDGLNVAHDTLEIKKEFTISHGTAFVLLAQMSSVLSYLHEKFRIFHGDIKPSNILVDLTKYLNMDDLEYSLEKLAFIKKKRQEALINPEPTPKIRFKLCDFGRSGYPMNLDVMDEGDGRYLPTLSDESDNKYLVATGRDVYSFGITLYECLGGTVNQFSADDIRNGQSIPWPSSISSEWRDIIRSMTVINTEQRITARQLLELEKVKSLVLPECLSLLDNDAVAPPVGNLTDGN